jgi:hypothetical protein
MSPTHARLRADALTAADLHEVSRLLATSADVVGLYVDKMIAPPAAAGRPEPPEP